MNRLWMLLGAGIVAGFMLLFIGGWIISTDIREGMEHDAEKQHLLVESTIERFKSSQEHLIKTLGQHPAVRHYETEKTETSALFLHTTTVHESIMQLRILAPDGMERLRVDRDRNGEVRLIATGALQDKSERYYTEVFQQLAPGEVGYSSFDLNVEHDRVERPFNPTLRMGYPIVLEGETRGYLVINYYMQSWIDEFGSFADTEFFVVGQDNYFLLHPSSDWAWSGYQEPPRKLGQYFSEVNTSGLWRGGDSVRWVDDRTIALPLELFGQTVLALYRPYTPIDALFAEKLWQLGGLSIVALLMVLLPAGGLIRSSFLQLQAEREKEQEQERFTRKIFENTFDGLVVIDAQGRICRANRAAGDLFGYTGDTLIGQNINVLVPSPHRDRHDTYLDGFSSRSRAIIGEDREIRGLHADGSTLPISIAITQADIDGHAHFIGTIRDLSLIRKLEMEARQQESMMIHQAKLAALGEMLVAIAHQWRQPLHGIGLIIQDVVFAQESDELTRDYLLEAQDEMMGQLRYLSDTIDEFRNFFSHEGRIDTCNLAKLVGEIQHLFRPQLKAHGISLKYCVVSEEGDHEICDLDDAVAVDALVVTTRPAEIKQLLLNLIANAREAIELLKQPSPDQLVITVTFLPSQQGPSIAVSDKAGGIAPELISRVFEPYFTTKDSGTGLGLFIANSLAERRLGGTLSYDLITEPGDGGVKGSRFTLRLPKALMENQEGDSAKESRK